VSARLSIAAAAFAVAITGCGGPAPRQVIRCDARRAPGDAARAGRSSPHTQCGPTLDLTPINQYRGDIASVQDREDAVALIDGDCTGTLIAAQAGPVVLTAGHCVASGERTLVAFNVEDQPDGDPLVTNGTVIEQSVEPDYALIGLDQLPASAPTLLTTRSSDRVAIIQHPRGGPKVIAEGELAAECAPVIYYTDLDTLAGSSGAGVLNQQGYLLAIHTDGDCAQDGGGANMGWTAASIVSASPYLQDGDIADR
jgi:hypothetical protein